MKNLQETGESGDGYWFEMGDPHSLPKELFDDAFAEMQQDRPKESAAWAKPEKDIEYLPDDWWQSAEAEEWFKTVRADREKKDADFLREVELEGGDVAAARKKLREEEHRRSGGMGDLAAMGGGGAFPTRVVK